MIGERELRIADETIDVVRKIQDDYQKLAEREDPNKETKKRAKDVQAAASILEREVRGLKEHMEKDEDIAG